MALQLSPDFELAPALKILFNVGAGFDIPTGTWMRGLHGEMILNGGMGFIVGMVGIGNNFKTTILNGIILRAMGRVFESCQPPEKKSQKKLTHLSTSYSTYDTEVNIQEPHLKILAKSIWAFLNRDIIMEKLWKITDKTVYWGNEWFEIFKDFLKFKRKNAAAYSVLTPFTDREDLTPGSVPKLMSVLLPTFGLVDSLTDFQSETEEKMMNENELGDSGANMLFMRGGAIKTRLLSELPALSGGAYHFMGLTAQLNKEIQMGGGPGGAAQPTKKLQYLKNGDRIVGATNKFTYATSVCFNAYNASPLVDKERMPEYAHPNSARNIGDTDLNTVKLTCLRNKNGPTGNTLTVVVTQREGLNVPLTEFHNLRENERFGIIGKGAYYTLALYPECALLRTTIRQKLEEDVKLRRAVTISSEMQQMTEYMPDLWSEVGCTPEVLYDDLKKLGYDWDVLLKTRGYWLFNNDSHPIPFLSTHDLLNMRKETYFPYWMTADKKGIKPEYQFESDLFPTT